MGIGVVQVAVTLLIILLLVKPVGKYIVNVFDGQRTGLNRVFGGPERLLYRVMGVRENESMGWKQYLTAVLLSNFVMLVLMFLVLRLQNIYRSIRMESAICQRRRHLIRPYPS